jgi:hypothetical protein
VQAHLGTWRLGVRPVTPDRHDVDAGAREPGDDVALGDDVDVDVAPVPVQLASLRMITARSLRNSWFATRIVPPSRAVDLTQPVDGRALGALLHHVAHGVLVAACSAGSPLISTASLKDVS